MHKHKMLDTARLVISVRVSCYRLIAGPSSPQSGVATKVQRGRERYKVDTKAQVFRRMGRVVELVQSTVVDAPSSVSCSGSTSHKSLREDQ